MADDTRQNDTPAARPKGPANIMPGGTAHTAGGKPANAEVPSYIDAVRSLGPEYYLNFHRRPCVRDSQLVGLGSGFVAGSVAAIVRQPVMMCCNIAVFSWIGLSCASYQYCQYYRSREKDGIRQAQELMAAKRANLEAKREARRREKEERDRLEEIRRKEEERQKTWGYWANKNLKFW